MRGGRERQLGKLTEAVCDAAVEADRAGVTALPQRHRRSTAETLYSLGFRDRAMQPAHCAGIADSYIRAFEEVFFTPDNPWSQVPELHVPGVARTDRRLAARFRDPAILLRSQCHNEWLKPQRLDHTVGTTVLVDPWRA